MKEKINLDLFSLPNKRDKNKFKFIFSFTLGPSYFTYQTQLSDIQSQKLIFHPNICNLACGERTMETTTGPLNYID